MGKTSIEWTRGDDGTAGRTWNCLRGCSRVSEGCRACYAERIAGRFCGSGMAFEGFARMTPNGARWTGRVELVPERLMDPLRWRKPCRVFVNSMSDLFHENLPDADIEQVFAVMALAPQHTFQVLTKRAARMREWFSDGTGPRAMNVRGAAFRLVGRDPCTRWPLPNVWLGVSAEDQAAADERIPHLLETPAAVRFISYEPALGPLDLDAVPRGGTPINGFDPAFGAFAEWQAGAPLVKLCDGIDWVIAGAESGHGARPMNEDWVRSVRDQCQRDGVSFFYKQRIEDRKKISLPFLDGRQHMEFPR